MERDFFSSHDVNNAKLEQVRILLNLEKLECKPYYCGFHRFMSLVCLQEMLDVPSHMCFYQVIRSVFCKTEKSNYLNFRMVTN